MESRDTSVTPVWQGERVAFTGRLGSLTRREARAIVLERGGQFARDVTRFTTRLVVGSSGLPLNHKGRLTRKLQRARWLQRQGIVLALLSEHEFLQRSELAPSATDRQLFVLADVEQITQLSRDRVRRWIDAGLVRPSAWQQAVPYFDFGDIRRLQNILMCLERGIRWETLRRSIRRLCRVVPRAEASLTAISSLDVWGRRVVIRSADGTLWDSSGQQLLDFDEPGAVTLELPRDLFDEALRCEEEEDWQGAAEAYEALLQRDGPDAEICFELANVWYALRRLHMARRRLQQAVDLEPDYVEAWNNLGNVLALLRDYPAAIQAYQCAVRLAPHWCDARYGLADVLDESGLRDQAARQWHLLLTSHPEPEYARYARQRLTEAGQAAHGPRYTKWT